MYLGNIVGSLAGAPLAAVDLALPFRLAAGLHFVAALVALTFREPPREASAEAAAESSVQAPGGERGGGRTLLRAYARYAATLVDAAELLRRRRRVALLIGYMTLLWLIPFLLAFMLLQPYALAGGFPVAWLGAVVLAIRGAAMAGGSLGPGLAARLGEAQSMTLATLLLGGLALLLGVVPTALGLGLFAAAGLVGAAIRPVLDHQLQREVPDALRATASSVQGLLANLAVALSTVVAGVVSDQAGLRALFAGLGIAVLVSGAGFLRALGAGARAVAVDQPEARS